MTRTYHSFEAQRFRVWLHILQSFSQKEEPVGQPVALCLNSTHDSSVWPALQQSSCASHWHHICMHYHACLSVCLYMKKNINLAYKSSTFSRIDMQNINVTSNCVQNGFRCTCVPLFTPWTGKHISRGLSLHQLDDLPGPEWRCN